MYIIAGLGNPGSKYENTRHNMGFKVIDRLAEEFGISVNRAKFKGLIGEGRIGNEKVILLKPQTYMNLSGQSVREIVDYYKVPDENLIVIYDDFDLPIGSIRIRKSGGPGTHNGMKSVVGELNSRRFPRVRIGIGSSDGSTIDFVIGKVSKSEQQILAETAKATSDAVADIIRIGIDNAMNVHNTRKSTDKDTGKSSDKTDRNEEKNAGKRTDKNTDTNTEKNVGTETGKNEEKNIDTTTEKKIAE
jgi:peptidyl-tRNA hydrolase, PTH1 family